MRLWRLNPLHWSWEWLFIFSAAVIAVSTMSAEIEIGNIDIPRITRAGTVVTADVIDADLGPSGLYVVSLKWTDAAMVPRQAERVRLFSPLAQQVGFSIRYEPFTGRRIDYRRPATVQIKYLPRPSPPPQSGTIRSELPAYLPPCSPFENCNVFILGADGQPLFDPYHRFWLIWGRWLIGLCVAGFLTALGLHIGGRLGRDQKPGAV